MRPARVSEVRRGRDCNWLRSSPRVVIAGTITPSIDVAACLFHDEVRALRAWLQKGRQARLTGINAVAANAW